MSGRIDPPPDPDRWVDEEFARLVAGIEQPREAGLPAAPGGAGGAARSGRRRTRPGPRLWITAALALIGLGAWAVAAPGPRTEPVDVLPAGTAQPWSSAEAAAASPAPDRAGANPDDRYFAGSPAAGWADGAAGFTVPAATALDGVTADQVASGYRLLVRVMAAGNLDATILNGGPVTDFTALLDPHSAIAGKLESWIAHPGPKTDPTLLVTRFNPATTRLLGHTVKVHGVLSAEPGPRPGTALLTADYVFVYAVGTPDGADAAVRRVTVHRTVQLEVLDPAEFVTVPGTAWLYDYAADMSDIRCYTHDGFVEPGFGGGGAPDVAGTADPYATGNLLASVVPYPSGTAGPCQAVSGD